MVDRGHPARRILQPLGQWIYSDPAVVLFDGNCRLCRRTIRLVKAGDVFGQVIPVDALDREARTEAGVPHLETDDLLEAMHVVVGEQSWSGFAACRVLAGRVPFFWPIWPLLYVWPVPLVGRRVYRHVAQHRSCRAGERSHR